MLNLLNKKVFLYFLTYLARLLELYRSEREENMINEKSTIAIPYYGSLIRPGRGLENIFLKGEYDPNSNQLENVSVSIWNPKNEGRLPKWLAAQGIKGIFCRDRNARYEELLSAEGIEMINQDDDQLIDAALA